ncbi:acyltransferase family protein [Rhodococcoides kroppenstedtii]|uniref:acyltransferase family protein n=1 Tax=Rhodococcoides kroppenstedtii TaxID=293050 RepID=UPI00363A65B1
MRPTTSRHRRESPSGPESTRHSRFRLDIQGLRAVAVVLVVLDHLLGWPRGGFIGVDVFFVISGFLITGLLLREGERHGRVSIADFYRRRARRILPVAVLVLAATVTASYVLLLAGRFDGVAVDAGWAMVFLINWHLASTGTDYFQSSLPPSPLQHYWSLAVEEQFYLVWPLVVGLVALTVGRRHGHRAFRVVLASVAAVAVALSFLWAVHQSAIEPTVAYFSTFTRIWELGAGALVALGAGLWGRIPASAASLLGAAGLGGIVASVFLVDPSSGFPAPAGLLPILATCAVLVAGAHRVPATTSVLTLRPVVYVGAVSYSLYLWHWPVIVLLESVLGPGPVHVVVSLAVMSAATVASYHLVEQPVLRSTLLRPGTDRRRASRTGDGQYALVGSLAVAAVLLGVAVAWQPAPVVAAGGPAPVLAAAAPEQNDPLEAAIRESLTARTFPALSPPLDDIDSGRPEEMLPGRDCLDPPAHSLDHCNYGDPSSTRSAFVVGDSVSMAWMPAIRGALEPRGFRVHGAAMANCPFIAADIAIVEDPAHSRDCNDSRDVLVDQILESRPTIVVMSDMEYGIQRLVDGAGSEQAWRQGRADIIDRVKGSGARIVVLSGNPFGKSPTDCATRVSTPRDCVSTVSANWLLMRNADRAAAEATGAEYVDTRAWFCYRDSCPIFVSGLLVRWDTGHITSDYGRYLAPRMQTALLPDGVPD